MAKRVHPATDGALERRDLLLRMCLVAVVGICQLIIALSGYVTTKARNTEVQLLTQTIGSLEVKRRMAGNGNQSNGAKYSDPGFADLVAMKLRLAEVSQQATGTLWPMHAGMGGLLIVFAVPLVVTLRKRRT